MIVADGDPAKLAAEQRPPHPPAAPGMLQPALAALRHVGEPRRRAAERADAERPSAVLEMRPALGEIGFERGTERATRGSAQDFPGNSEAFFDPGRAQPPLAGEQLDGADLTGVPALAAPTDGLSAPANPG